MVFQPPLVENPSTLGMKSHVLFFWWKLFSGFPILATLSKSDLTRGNPTSRCRVLNPSSEPGSFDLDCKLAVRKGWVQGGCCLVSCKALGLHAIFSIFTLKSYRNGSGPVIHGIWPTRGVGRVDVFSPARCPLQRFGHQLMPREVKGRRGWETSVFLVKFFEGCNACDLANRAHWSFTLSVFTDQTESGLTIRWKKNPQLEQTRRHMGVSENSGTPQIIHFK